MLCVDCILYIQLWKVRQERRRTSKGQSVKKDKGRGKAKKADLGEDWIKSDSAASSPFREVLFFHRTVGSHLVLDIAHPFITAKSKISVLLDEKSSCLPCFKDANPHSPASIFRLALSVGNHTASNPKKESGVCWWMDDS